MHKKYYAPAGICLHSLKMQLYNDMNILSDKQKHRNRCPISCVKTLISTPRNLGDMNVLTMELVIIYVEIIL
jgi:hypothetical protein